MAGRHAADLEAQIGRERYIACVKKAMNVPPQEQSVTPVSREVKRYVTIDGRDPEPGGACRWHTNGW